MKRTQAIRTEVRAILRSPKFERASVLSAILNYLAEAELAGRNAPSQDDIAADVLGKDLAQWDPADSCVRVAVSRLRTALEEYYLVHQPGDTLCIHVRKGEYRIRLASLEVAYPKIADALSSAGAAPKEDCLGYQATTGSNELATVTSGRASPNSASDQASAPMANSTENAEGGTVSESSYSVQVGKDSSEVSLSGATDLSAKMRECRRPLRHFVLASGVSAAKAKSIERLPSASELPFKKFFAVAMIVVAAVISAVKLHPTNQAAAATDARSAVDVPYILSRVELVDTDSSPITAQRMNNQLTGKISNLLRKSIISRLAEDNDARWDFILQIDASKSDDGFSGNVTLADTSNRIVTEKSFSSIGTIEELEETISDEVIGIISPTGHIARTLLERIGEEPINGFECFLSVEGLRISTEDYSRTLDRCISNFAESEFAPHLLARRAFSSAQSKLASGEPLEPTDSSWRAVSSILAEYPENPYANAVAAKMLIGRGMCQDAASFAADGFSRGRTYPTIELSIIVDAYGCDELSNLRPYWGNRIAKIAEANLHPDPLMETYLLIGALVSGQTELLDNHKSPLFGSSSTAALGELNYALRRMMEGTASTQHRAIVQDSLPRILFHAGTRNLLLEQADRLKLRKAKKLAV